MVSVDELNDLLSYEKKPGSHVLTVYLNVDQGRADNLNRMYERALRTMVRELGETLSEQSDRDEFERDVEALYDFMAEYSPEGRTLVVLVDSTQQFLWHRNIRVGLPSEAHWGERPHVRRLLEVHDEYERYAAVLTDRAQGRVFKVFLNEIEETESFSASESVKRFSSPARDMIWSQPNLRRSAEESAKRYLKNLAELMEEYVDDGRVDRLVVGGPIEAVSELEKLLPDRIRQRIIGDLSLAVEATPKEVLAATMRVGHEFERAVELELVERLLTAAQKRQQAVVGLAATVQAVNEGRVMTLVYADGQHPAGSECTACHYLSGTPGERCPYCDGETAHIADLVEVLAVEVVRNGGRLEHIAGEAALRLENEARGIGAFLRF